MEWKKVEEVIFIFFLSILKKEVFVRFLGFELEIMRKMFLLLYGNVY